jgi:hypothetical protein
MLICLSVRAEIISWKSSSDTLNDIHEGTMVSPGLFVTLSHLLMTWTTDPETISLTDAMSRFIVRHRSAITTDQETH